MKLTDLGERAIIGKLGKTLNIGDDCAVIPFCGTNLVLTTDMLWGPTHIPRGMAPEQIGKLAVSVNLSDIAAMGAMPFAFLLSYGSPDVDIDYFDSIISGAKRQCEKYGAEFAGGDTNQTGELTLAGTAIGQAKKPVMRSGAKRGDVVAVTGKLGASALALKMLEAGISPPGPVLCSLYEPEPKIRQGLKIGKSANAMTDISDGLAVSLYDITCQSGVGMEIDLEKIPIGENARRAAGKSGIDILERALYGGGDYELVFTVPKDKWEKLSGLATKIGAVAGRGVFGVTGGKREKIERRGYEHFVKK